MLCATILRMDNDKGSYGRALYAVLQAEWDAKQTNRNAWAISAGLNPTTVKRWNEGSDPGVESLRPVARALGKPMLEVLVAAGILTSDEAGGVTVQSPHECLVEDAIRFDRTISEGERGIMKNVWDGLKLMRAGAEQVKGSNSQLSTKGTRRSQRRV